MLWNQFLEYTPFLYQHSVFKVSLSTLSKLLTSVLFYEYNFISEIEYV